MSKEIKKITAKDAVDHINNMNKLLGNDVYFELEESKVVELEPIIIKSGETWVAEYEGIDYLCILPETPMNLLKDMTPHKIKSFWKPISEIEITDDIAKLRPNIMYLGCLDVLVYVDNTYYHTVSCHVDKNRHFKNFKLATVKDLQESKC